ncbi:unnamed protein product, partial [Amoebophrya sp. A25]
TSNAQLLFGAVSTRDFLHPSMPQESLLLFACGLRNQLQVRDTCRYLLTWASAFPLNQSTLRYHASTAGGTEALLASFQSGAQSSTLRSQEKSAEPTGRRRRRRGGSKETKRRKELEKKLQERGKSIQADPARKPRRTSKGEGEGRLLDWRDAGLIGLLHRLQHEET